MTILLIIISILLWASTFVGIRAAISEYAPIDLAVLRFIISSLILLLFAIAGKIRLPNKRDMMIFLCLGFVLFATSILLNYGAQTLTAGETTFIASTSQIFQVILAYYFLNELVSLKFILGILLSFFGVALIAFENSTGFHINPGIFFVLAAAIFGAFYFVLQKPVLKKYRPIEVISYSIWIATLLMLPFGKNLLQKIPEAAASSSMTVIYLGVSTVIANLCWATVLSKIEAKKAATILYIVPVAAIGIGYIWLHELPSLLSCFGGIIIIGGVFISNTKISITAPSTGCANMYRTDTTTG